MNETELFTIPKENAFTAIRLICALIVVYEHFIVLTGIKLPSLEIRGLAVKVFFFLSGFWVTRSYFSSNSLVVFYKKRIKKIFPMYLIVIFTFAILLVFMSTLSFCSYFQNRGFWKYLAANISTLNFLHPDLPGVFNGEPVNGSLWTIKVELGFYFVLPFIVFLCKCKSRKMGDCTLFILIIIYIFSVLYVNIIPLFINRFQLSQSISNQLPAFLSYFSIGMLCFFFYEQLTVFWNKLIIPSIIILPLCIIIKNNCIISFIEPIILCNCVMWTALKAKPLYKISKVYDFSYILYLVHYPIIMIIKYLYLVKQ